MKTGGNLADIETGQKYFLASFSRHKLKKLNAKLNVQISTGLFTSLSLIEKLLQNTKGSASTVLDDLFPGIGLFSNSATISLKIPLV